MFHSLWSRFQILWTFYFYCSASSSEQSWILTRMTHWQMNYVMLFRARKGTKWTCLEIYFSRLQLVLWCLLLSVNSWLCPSIHTHPFIHFLMCAQVWAAVYKETRPFLPKCKLKLFQRNSQLRPTSPGAGRGGPQVQVETLLMEKGLHVA